MLRQFRLDRRAARRARVRRLRHQGSARAAARARPARGAAGGAAAPAGAPPTPAATDVRAGPTDAAERRASERIRATATASCTPKACRCPRSPSASARPATSTRARRSRARTASSTRRSRALPHLVCYAMKANSNLAILDLFARLGSGFDIVSGGELARVLAAGGDPRKVVFSGVGKTEAEMDAGARRRHPVLQRRVGGRARRASTPSPRRLGKRAPVSFRVNPDVDPKTHPYIATGLKESKFGVAFDDAPALYRRAARAAEHRRPRHRHPHRLADHRARAVPRGGEQGARPGRPRSRADGIALAHVDLGGGLGIRYRDEEPVALADVRRDGARAVRGPRASGCCSSPAGASSATPACC